MNSPTSNWIIVKIEDSLLRFSFLDFTSNWRIFLFQISLQAGEDELSVRFCLDISLDSGSQLIGKIGKIGKIGCLLYVDKDNDNLDNYWYEIKLYNEM